MCQLRRQDGVANKKLPRIKWASVHFGTSTLALETDFDALDDVEKLEEEIKKSCKSMSPMSSYIKEAQNKSFAFKKSGPDLERPLPRKQLLRLALGLAIYLAALFLGFPPAFQLFLYGAAYLLLGGEILINALSNIRRGQLFDENFLMSLATAGAFALKEYPEAVAVMLFYQIGALFENMATVRSRRFIQSLLEIKPAYANLKRGDTIFQIAPEEVRVGDIVIVKPGERVPLDGFILEGRCLVDTSALTGESLPREVKPGEEILSGFINTSGLLTVKVTKEFGDSTVARILHLVQNAAERKAPAENFITRFARYYTPAVVGFAAMLAFIFPLFFRRFLFCMAVRALIFWSSPAPVPWSSLFP